MSVERRLTRLEQQTVSPMPCTCKDLHITRTGSGREVVSLLPCLQHKRLEPVVVKRLVNVSMNDL